MDSAPITRLKASSITNFKTGKTNKMPRIHVQTQFNKEIIEKVKGTNGLGTITYHWINKFPMLG